jgi:hypothetical protein
LGVTVFLEFVLCRFLHTGKVARYRTSFKRSLQSPPDRTIDLPHDNSGAQVGGVMPFGHLIADKKGANKVGITTGRWI